MVPGMGKIENTFDGLKLARQYEDNGTVTGTDYCGPFVYETVSGVRSLKYILTPHGRALKNGSLWTREFNLRDHLGNVRVVIRKGGNGQAEIVQQKGYYPFGGEISQFSTGTGTNRHWYNGKELQDDLSLYWYDYGARFYDPQLGRWHSVDPLAKSYYSQSPYHFSGNNPIKFVDLNGMNYDGWELTLKNDGTKDLEWISDKGGNQTQYVNTKWETSSGETWDLGTETWNNWPNSDAGMMDIMSGGEAALGAWNPKWWDKSSGRIDYSPIDPIDLATGAVAAKWAISGAKVATRGISLADEAFVHITPSKYASIIMKDGLDPAFSGGKSYVTRWGSVKNVTNSSEFNTMLYRQDLWKSTVGKFDEGATILHIDAKPTFFSPRTNWVNGVPQYIYTSPVFPKYITPITSF